MSNKKIKATYSHTIGVVAMEGRGFSNPVDLVISSENLIYVLSRTNPEQPEGIRIGTCNMESEYFRDFGWACWVSPVCEPGVSPVCEPGV